MFDVQPLGRAVHLDQRGVPVYLKHLGLQMPVVGSMNDHHFTDPGVLDLLHEQERSGYGRNGTVDVLGKSHVFNTSSRDNPCFNFSTARS